VASNKSDDSALERKIARLCSTRLKAGATYDMTEFRDGLKGDDYHGDTRENHNSIDLFDAFLSLCYIEISCGNCPL